MTRARVLVLVSQILNKRNFERFYIDKLANKFELVILDFTYVLHKRVFDVQISGQIKGLDIIYIKTKRDFFDYEESLNHFKYIVSFLGNIYESNQWIFQSLKPHQNKLCIIARNGFPGAYKNYQISIFIRIIKKIRREKSLLGLLNKLKFYAVKFMNLDHGMEIKYLVSGGENITKQFSYFIGNKTELVKSCSDDYIASFKKMAKQVYNDYFVFLDENLIDHSDYLINNARVEEEYIYYDELNKFFKFLEDKHNIEIVIAAHPRADFNKTKSRFLGRKVFQNSTLGLVKHCQACITHASTSINFAVIYNKPIIFLTSDRMIKTRQENELLASWFNKSPLNMSNINEVEKFVFNFSINKVLYTEFKKSFISYSKNCAINYEFLNG